MEIIFKSKKIGKIFNDFPSLSRKFGHNQARKIIQRLNEFKSAESLNDIKMLPSTRLHALEGNLKGYLVFGCRCNTSI